MKIFEKQNKLNDRGSTFIEIIVSVLIVGIVFVPLLLGLNTAIMVNRISQNEMYADTVAQNCLETVKAIHRKGVQDRVASIENAKDESGNDAQLSKRMKEIYGFYIADEESAGPGLTPEPTMPPLKSFDECYSGATIFQPNPKLEKYVVSGIKQGTKDYYAEIEFMDEFSDKGMQNDPDGLASIDVTKGTAVVKLAAKDKKVFENVAEMARESISSTEAIGYLKEKKTKITIKKYTGDSTYGNKYVVFPSIEYIFYNEKQEFSGKSVFSSAAGNTYTYVYEQDPQIYDTCPKRITVYMDTVTDITASSVNTVPYGPIKLSDNIASNKEVASKTVDSYGNQRVFCKESVEIDKQTDSDISVIYNIYGVDLNDRTNAYYTGSRLGVNINNCKLDSQNLCIFIPIGKDTASGDVASVKFENDGPIADATYDDIMKLYKVRVTVNDVDSNYSLTRESTVYG